MISMPLYRRQEKNAQLLDFKCVEFVEELLCSQYHSTFDLVGRSALSTHISSARRVQENVFEVGFRRRPGGAESGGGLGQRAPGEQAGEQLWFSRRQAKGGKRPQGPTAAGPAINRKQR